MDAVDVRGRFVWHQLLTRDVPAAKKFYPTLTGWSAQSWPLDPSYTVCAVAGAPTAGMMAFTPEVPADAPPHWLPYIGTRDVDGTAAAAVRAGGAIIKDPSDMKGAGRYAVLRDPQDAIFAVIDPENARPEPAGMAPLGHFSWHELATTDHEAAFAFYNELFGWDAMQRMDMGALGIYLIFGYRGEQKGGIYVKPPDMQAPPHWLSYVRVAGVDAAVPTIEAAGGKVTHGPMDVPGGSRIVMINDPTGAAVALHSTQAGATVTAGAAAEEPVVAEKAPAAVKPEARSKAKGKTKAKSRAKPKTRTRAKAKAKARSKVKSAARKTARGKSKSKAKAKKSSRQQPRARAKARPKKKVARRKK